VLRLSGEIEIFNSTPAGTTIGRKLNECGQIGVTMIAGTLGWIIDAPAATAYAVDPVGVDTINPRKKKFQLRSSNQTKTHHLLELM
jgi:hypothetical protein